MPKHVDPASLVAGIHPVEALLRSSPGRVHRLVLLQGPHPRLHALQKLAEDQSISVQQLPKAKLDQFYRGPHQGALAFCHVRARDDWEAVKRGLLAAARGGAEEPHVVVPAALEDPRNLGACIRSAVGFGADAVLAHRKGNPGLTPTVAKAAAGALERIYFCQVADIEKELRDLKAGGFAVAGLEADGRDIQPQDCAGPRVFVVGGEDRGIPPHIRRCCDSLLRLPMAPGAHSFNASVALSLLLYEVNRQGGFARLAKPRLKIPQTAP